MPSQLATCLSSSIEFKKRYLLGEKTEKKLVITRAKSKAKQKPRSNSIPANIGKTLLLVVERLNLRLQALECVGVALILDALQVLLLQQQVLHHLKREEKKGNGLDKCNSRIPKQH